LIPDLIDVIIHGMCAWAEAVCGVLRSMSGSNARKLNRSYLG
jgi:hypothetical protein